MHVYCFQTIDLDSLGWKRIGSVAEREGFEPVYLKGLQSESKGEKIPYDPLMPPDLCTDLCTTLG
jgi:hypothetical protein